MRVRASDTVGSSFVREYNNAWTDWKREEAAIIVRLKEFGVRYWRRNDGWVERDEAGVPLAVTAVSSRFNLGVKVGDKVAVGDSLASIIVKRVSAIKLNVFGGAPCYELVSIGPNGLREDLPDIQKEAV